MLQKFGPRRGKVLPIIGIDALKRDNAGLDDVLGSRKIHAHSFKAKVTANKTESAAGIVVLHVKHAVQPDRRVGVKARQQAPLALVPKVIPQPLSAVFRAHDEETHEAVLFLVSDN